MHIENNRNPLNMSSIFFQDSDDSFSLSWDGLKKLLTGSRDRQYLKMLTGLPENKIIKMSLFFTSDKRLCALTRCKDSLQFESLHFIQIFLHIIVAHYQMKRVIYFWFDSEILWKFPITSINNNLQQHDIVLEKIIACYDHHYVCSTEETCLFFFKNSDKYT